MSTKKKTDNTLGHESVLKFYQLQQTEWVRISSRQSSGLKHTSHWTWVTPSSGRGAGGFYWELVYSLFLMKTTLDRCCLMPGQC